MPTTQKKASIAGVGFTTLTRTPDRPEVALGIEACRMAADDAGLDPADIDGISIQVHHYPPPDAPAIIKGLGMKAVNWRYDQGPVGMGSVGMAARVVDSGQAKAIVICKIMNTVAPISTPDIDPGTGAIGGDMQFETPFGLAYTMQRMGLLGRRYMHRYGVTERQIGQVAIVAREYAIAHPYAYQKKPLSMEDYLSSRWIAEPVRLLDCDLPINGAFAYLVVSEDLARSRKHKPVWVKAWGEGIEAEREGGLVKSTGHLRAEETTGLSPIAETMYRDAGLSPKDMDIAYPYDGFTFFVPMWLESLGLVPRGEAGHFLEGGDRIRPDGELPVNTHGGNLSSGRMHGQGHIMEAVEQLRGTAGERQVKKPVKHAVLSTAFFGSGFTGILGVD